MSCPYAAGNSGPLPEGHPQNTTNSMYIRPEHREGDVNKLLQFIEQYLLGTIITYSKDNGISTQALPFTIHTNNDGKKVLRCHYPRVAAQFKDLSAMASGNNGDNLGEQVLIVFYGPHSYISSSWYPSKTHNNSLVPTWDISCVHVRGHVKVIDDPELVYNQAQQLTTITEQQIVDLDPNHKRWSITDAPKSTMLLKIQQLVVIEVAIDSIEGKFKLGAGDFENKGIIQGLGRVGNHALATILQKPSIDTVLQFNHSSLSHFNSIVGKQKGSNGNILLNIILVCIIAVLLGVIFQSK